jgi:MinD-like ATPase involved in chromosome partitioning or flagellar assembly
MMATSIVVAAGVRGVGVSCVAAGLAVEYAAGGHETLLVDCTEDGSLASAAGEGTHGSHLSLSVLDPSTLPGAMPRALRRQRAKELQALFASYEVVIVDSGARVATVSDLASDASTSVLAVSSSDAVAGASTYALVKHLRMERPRVPVWILENRESDGEGFVAWGRIAECAARFLGAAPRLAGILPESIALTARLSRHAAGAAAEMCSAAPIVAEVARQLMTAAPHSSLTTHHSNGNRPALALAR